MPDEDKAVAEAEKAAEAAQAKAEEEREEAELDAIDIDTIPMASWQLVGNAARQILTLKVQIETEIKPAMAVARKRHNEPELRRLGEVQAQHEDIIRRTLREFPKAREQLAQWAKEDKPETV